MASKRLFTAATLGLIAVFSACSADGASDDSTNRRPPPFPSVGPGGTIPGTAAGSGSTTPGVLPGGTISNPAAGLLPPPPANVGGGGGCKNATIALVIDGSGSMCEPFGMSTRWTELRNALLDKQAGLIYRVQSMANFGLYLYDGSIDPMLLQGAPMGMASTCNSPGSVRRFGAKGCEQIVEVKPAGGNAAMIDAAYPASELGGSTPTDKAMNYAVDSLLKSRPANWSTAFNPQFIILATDGAPNDICTGGTGGDGTAQQQAVIAAADKAAASSITTFVISLASDPALQAHLDMVAKHGDPLDPAAKTYVPTDSAQLVTTLTNLLGSALGCLF